MSIRDLMEQFEIQGAYRIKNLSKNLMVSGNDFECEHSKIKDEYLDARITYMYVVNERLHIEVE